MSKCTRLNKINYYYNSGDCSGSDEPLEAGLTEQRAAGANRQRTCCGAPAAEPPRDYSKTILATKSLTNLITINHKPLLATERRARRHHRVLVLPASEAQEDQLHLYKRQLYKHQQHLRSGASGRVGASRLKRASSSKLHTSNTIAQERLKMVPLRQRAMTAGAPLAGAPQKPPAKQTMTIISPGVGTRSGKLMMVEHSRVRSYKLAFLSLVSISLILVICCVTTNGVQSLSCYNCTSADDPACDEPFSGKAHFNSTDCKDLVPAGQTAKVCRKIVQHMHDLKVVIRSCGYLDEHEEKDRKNMCYKRSGTFAVTMEACNCYQDGCNHSASLVPNLSVFLLVASLTSLWIYSRWPARQQSSLLSN